MHGTREMPIEPILLMLKFLKEPPLTYVALKEFVEKERPGMQTFSNI
jgi:hypothetical protein